MIHRLALCNEVLAPWPFERQCAYAAALGYRGLEVAPYTLADDPTTLTEAQARAFAAVAADHDLAITGLHWLLVAPKGLSISHPDATVQARTRAALDHLIDLCAAMGGRYLVHGSPAQRNPQPGQTHADALARATEAWVRCGERAGPLGLAYCIEPLSRDQTSVVNTVAEAAAIVQAAALPGLRTMLDTCSAGATEAEPLPALIERWWGSGLLAHVQLNDRNRRGPGQGTDRFGPILAALQRQGYAGWLAMEPFDYQPDGPGCAARAIGHVQGLLEGLTEGPTEGPTRG
ncbi:MAG: sugar phosphate isomerase/epimerase [Rubrivivax sp.]|nr:sugar phosphate isomerase/epimerase [Rubrivivax sp.]